MRKIIIFLVFVINIAGVCFAQSDCSPSTSFGKGLNVGEASTTFGKGLDVGEASLTFGKGLSVGEASVTFGKALKVGEASATFGHNLIRDCPRGRLFNNVNPCDR